MPASQLLAFYTGAGLGLITDIALAALWAKLNQFPPGSHTREPVLTVRHLQVIFFNVPILGECPNRVIRENFWFICGLVAAGAASSALPPTSYKHRCRSYVSCNFQLG